LLKKPAYSPVIKGVAEVLLSYEQRITSLSMLNRYSESEKEALRKSISKMERENHFLHVERRSAFLKAAIKLRDFIEGKPMLASVFRKIYRVFAGRLSVGNGKTREDHREPA
jgi:hypothetical protein